jgi:hypothetical protein
MPIYKPSGWANLLSERMVIHLALPPRELLTKITCAARACFKTA